MRVFLKNILYQVCFGLRNSLEPFFHFTEVSILAYHSISVDASETAILPEIFEEHLQLLKKNGVTFVPLEDVVAWRRKQRTLPKRAVAMTFDDGYADFETAALPILEKYQIPTTLFFVGSESASRSALANKQPLLSLEALERLSVHPLIKLGYHSYSHANLMKCSGEELAHEVRSPIPLPYFAYPGGNYSRATIAAVHDAGYEAAFSIKPTLMSRHAARYVMPRNVITKNLHPWEVLLRTTKAISWYRRLTRPL